jgi:hypothetical protein
MQSTRIPGLPTADTHWQTPCLLKMKELAYYAGLGRVQEFEQIRAKLYNNVGLWTISVVVCSADVRSTSF